MITFLAKRGYIKEGLERCTNDSIEETYAFTKKVEDRKEAEKKEAERRRNIKPSDF